ECRRLHHHRSDLYGHAVQGCFLDLRRGRARRSQRSRGEYALKPSAAVGTGDNAYEDPAKAAREEASAVSLACGFLPNANDAKRRKLAFVNRIRIIPSCSARKA